MLQLMMVLVAPTSSTRWMQQPLLPLMLLMVMGPGWLIVLLMAAPQEVMMLPKSRQARKYLLWLLIHCHLGQR